MARKENQRIALTRRLLQEGLLRLLAHNKLDDISVTALCREAGINRATFYNHYNSPSQLLEEMEHALVSELSRLNPPVSSIEDILENTEKSCILLKENAALIDILVCYHIDRDLEDIVKHIAQYYGERRLDTAHTELDSDSLRLVSSFLYTGCYALIREWLVHDIEKTPHEIAQLLISIVNKEYL
ncbi:MAG: TetR/AcrR family transcriptional regulator C-terminal domain-containing protein [Oscillospiraceae bacterium]|nr:TetR/AcrR family transcriptional regulator C-terminal domain-containing protein [Oscillospiraceae bacterium]